MLRRELWTEYSTHRRPGERQKREREREREGGRRAMAVAVAARGPLSTIATRLRADTSSFFLQPQQPLLVPRRLQLPSLVCSYGRRSLSSSVAITPSSRDAGDVLDAATRVELAFVVGASVIPHPDKVEKGGEDAYFISDYGGGVLGVADGVSGWAAEDVDPALYSRELMAHASNAAASEEMESNARLLLHKAHSATCSIGAATAIVAILDRSGTLHVANVGDCGLRILRSGKVVFATSPQQHYFDCPYQFSSSEGGQSASDAAVFKAELLKGDTIVLGSDGLFDNVYDRDIESTLSVFGGSDQESAERSATALAILANKHSRDETYESPYSREAIQQGLDLPWWKKILGKKLAGGKVDDITVLVGHVVDAEILPKPTPSLVSADLVDSSPDSAAATDVEAPPSKDESPADLPDQFPEGLAESWA